MMLTIAVRFYVFLWSIPFFYIAKGVQSKTCCTWLHMCVWMLQDNNIVTSQVGYISR